MIELLTLLLLTHLTIVCVSIYLHRSLAHRALTLHPIAEHVVRFYLWLTTGIIARQWVAVHRKHHSKVDVDGDPHSPQLLGFWTILLLGTLQYLRAGRNAAMMQAYGRGCPNDWIEKNLYSKLPYLGVIILLLTYVAIFNELGALMWLVHFLWIPFWAAGVVNGVGHFFGYRNYSTNDASKNFCPLGIIMAGEEHHNNHHAFPASPKLSRRWFEFDSGWMWIRCLETLGLACLKK